MRVVVDTNVLVSGLLSAKGPPGQIVDALFSGRLRPVYTDAIMQEYRNVLARPKFGFDPHLTATVINAIEAAGEFIPAALLMPAGVTCSDPYDQVFIDCAHTGGCDLITGNRKHFPQRSPITILSPRQAIER